MRLVLPSPADCEGLRPSRAAPGGPVTHTDRLAGGWTRGLSLLVTRAVYSSQNQLTQLPKYVQGAAKISFLALQKLNPDGNVSSPIAPTSHELCRVHGIS